MYRQKKSPAGRLARRPTGFLIETRRAFRQAVLRSPETQENVRQRNHHHHHKFKFIVALYTTVSAKNKPPRAHWIPSVILTYDWPSQRKMHAASNASQQTTLRWAAYRHHKQCVPKSDQNKLLSDQRTHQRTQVDPPTIIITTTTETSIIVIASGIQHFILITQQDAPQGPQRSPRWPQVRPK